MSICCIPICPNSNANGKPPEIASRTSVSFHPFPQNEILRSQWFDALAISNPLRFRWKIKTVCSDHFLPSDLLTKDGEIRLADRAIPSICDLDDEDTMNVAEDEDQSRISHLKDQFCRLCFHKHSTLFPLNARIHNMNLTEIIRLICGVQFHPNLNLPNRICSGCMTKVDFAFNVRLEFQMNAEKLRALVKEGRLLSYYEQYEPPSNVSNGTKDSYIDSIMKTSREVLVERNIIKTSKHTDIHDFEILVLDDKTAPSHGTCAIREQFDNVEHLIEQDMVNELDALGYEEIWDEDILNPVDLEAFRNNIKADQQEDSIVYDLTDDNASGHKKKDANDPSDANKSYVFSWTELVKPKKSRPKKPAKKLVMPELIPNKCYVCVQAFTSEQVLEEHLTSHVAMLPYKCEQCSIETNPIVLKGMVSLNRHLQSHLYPYTCPQCPQRFSTQYGRYSHIRWIHRNFQKDGFTCDVCGKTFDKKRTFLAHALKHRSQTEQRFKCSKCCKVFTTKVSLDRHTRTHTGECPFECPYCGKRFNHQYNFRQHKLLHLSGQKSYRCEHCPKVFVRFASLRRHLREHFPDRIQNSNSESVEPQEVSSVCRFCSVQFSDFEARRDHEHRQHTTHQEVLETIELVSKEEIEQLVSAGFVQF
ncbi:zinc finger protein 350-like [Topomyia yanbarensis]|uniref:zinc finger protein 350-like n=1 Tax=Topomyia yanbarensis TaxID=2498891 RepID=UPI00273BEC06|nr:zinc finger protein 350-like [Topomyia yanbarensis]